MTFTINMKGQCRIVPIRFEQAHRALAVPDREYPHVDDRGYNHSVPKTNGVKPPGSTHGAVVGIASDQKAYVAMVRQHIDVNTTLYATSSDQSVFTVESNDEVGNQNICTIELKSARVTGTNKPQTAYLQIHYNQPNGPVIARLLVYVFPMLRVFVQPHFVTVHQEKVTPPNGATLAPNLRYEFDRVTDIFYNCGVELVFRPDSHFDIELTRANYVEVTRDYYSELHDITDKRWTKDSINIYFVRDWRGLGKTASKALPSGSKFISPSIVISYNKLANELHGDPRHISNVLAHEIGHHFGLRHPSEITKSEPLPLYDGWSMHFLMHNYVQVNRGGNNLVAPEWYGFNETGHDYDRDGLQYLGNFISLKQVRKGDDSAFSSFKRNWTSYDSPNKDGQVARIRNRIGKGSAILYGKKGYL